MCFVKGSAPQPWELERAGVLPPIPYRPAFLSPGSYAQVKLVGPTISCEGSPYKGNAKGEWRTNPHVQSYVLATDQV